MSEHDEQFREGIAIFGLYVGTCTGVNSAIYEAVHFENFQANEVGLSLGLIDSHILEVDFYSAEIDSYDKENKKTPLTHKISFSMNVPVSGVVGE